MKPKVLVLIISLLVAAACGALAYYFKDGLPPWAIGAFLGIPLAGGLLAAALVPTTPEKPSPVEKEPEEPKDIERPPSPEPVAEKAPESPEPEASAAEAYVASFLGALQKEGRFLDFLQEDLARYDDTQIGAAVRSIHPKLRAVVFEIVELAPVIEAEEGTEVWVEEDFDPQKIRLIGNVKGKPPFKGILRHPGWRFRKIKLPKPRKDQILAPAEVEIP